MKSDVIKVSTGEAGMEETLRQAERTAQYKGLSPRNALHLRLLTEETMGMMRSITGEREGLFWIEDEDGVFQLHLAVKTRMNSDKRGQLLSAATTGKNESAKGLMGRLRDFFDRGTDEDVASFTSPMLLPGLYDHSALSDIDWEWSMTRYQDELSARVKENDLAAKEAWDELEKSVVVHVADEVKVSIRGDQVEMIIYKKMNG